MSQVERAAAAKYSRDTGIRTSVPTRAMTTVASKPPPSRSRVDIKLYGYGERSDMPPPDTPVPFIPVYEPRDVVLNPVTGIGEWEVIETVSSHVPETEPTEEPVPEDKPRVPIPDDDDDEQDDNPKNFKVVEKVLFIEDDQQNSAPSTFKKRKTNHDKKRNIRRKDSDI